MRYCTIRGCEKPLKARGFCSAHWARWRQGRPMHEPLRWQDRQEDFWRQVRKTKTCWIWTGGINKSGYGTFSWNGHHRYTHRLAYTWLVGTIPKGLQLDHVKARGCKSRACCNPAHLEPVTPEENARRARLQAKCSRGHAYTKSNTYWRPDGQGRQCIKCQKIRYKRKKAKDAAALL